MFIHSILCQRENDASHPRVVGGRRTARGRGRDSPFAWRTTTTMIRSICNRRRTCRTDTTDGGSRRRHSRHCGGPGREWERKEGEKKRAREGGRKSGLINISSEHRKSPVGTTIDDEGSLLFFAHPRPLVDSRILPPPTSSSLFSSNQTNKNKKLLTGALTTTVGANP